MQNWADKGQTNRTTGGLDASTLCKKGPYLEFFGSYFPAFGLNSDSFPHTLYRTRKTPNTDTFHAVAVILILSLCCKSKYFFKLIEHCRK